MLTGVGYFPDTPNLDGGSVDSTMSFASLPVIYPTIFLVIFGLLLFIYLKKPTVIKSVFLSLNLFLWILSGRMIGIGWPDGRLSSGWFNVGTESVFLCDEKNDCETTIYYQTKVEKLLFWRVRIKNQNFNEVIFVGPLLWGRTLLMINKTAGVGMYLNRKLPD
jgi:hypothetical protein